MNNNKPITSACFAGGLGNVLFQISKAYSYSRKYNTTLKFLRNQFDGCSQGNHPSMYYENLFSKLEFENQMPQFQKIISEKSWAYYHDEEESFKNLNVIFKGYFQSEKNFKEYSKEIKDLFTPHEGFKQYLENKFNFSVKNLNLSEDDVFIGVRRGDYIDRFYYHFPCEMDYYSKAIEKYSDKKRCYYIMSSDLEWCKNNFVDNEYCTFKFINFESDLQSLLFGCLFKNYIISNSSFYWWMTFLSIYDNPRVLVPDKWINELGYESVYRENMEIIKRNIYFYDKCS